MATIFLKKYPSAKKPAAVHTHPPKRRRKEGQSEIVLLEKKGETYEGKKTSLKQACPSAGNRTTDSLK